MVDALVSSLEALGLHRNALYVFDYGAPVGFRLAWPTPSASPPIRLHARMTRIPDGHLEGTALDSYQVDAYTPISPAAPTWQRCRTSGEPERSSKPTRTQPKEGEER